MCLQNFQTGMFAMKELPANAKTNHVTKFLIMVIVMQKGASLIQIIIMDFPGM